MTEDTINEIITRSKVNAKIADAKWDAEPEDVRLYFGMAALTILKELENMFIKIPKHLKQEAIEYINAGLYGCALAYKDNSISSLLDQMKRLAEKEIAKKE